MGRNAKRTQATRNDKGKQGLMKIKVDKLDILFSQFIRLRADGKCEYCGKYVGLARLQCSHFVGRRKRATRYDSDNACALDFSCHTYLQEHPYQHTEWFKKRLGSEKFEQLNIRAEQIVKIDKEATKADFLEKIRRLQNE